MTLHKKWSFPLRVSSVNVTKSAVSCEFGHVYWKILNGKLHFLCSDKRKIEPTRFINSYLWDHCFVNNFLWSTIVSFFLQTHPPREYILEIIRILQFSKASTQFIPFVRNTVHNTLHCVDNGFYEGIHF